METSPYRLSLRPEGADGDADAALQEDASAQHRPLCCPEAADVSQLMQMQLSYLIAFYKDPHFSSTAQKSSWPGRIWPFQRLTSALTAVAPRGSEGRGQRKQGAWSEEAGAWSEEAGRGQMKRGRDQRSGGCRRVALSSTTVC